MPTVAIVDDDPVYLQAACDILEEEGYQVEPYGAIRFTQSYQQLKPDIMLVDVWFGDQTDGLRLSQALANHQDLHHIPLILVSSDAKVAKYAERVHADDYIVKPFDVAELLQKMRRLLKNKDS